VTTSFTELGELLSSIKPFAPEAHIAGGAVRDLILNRPVKDIDVFISSKNLFAVRNVILQRSPHEVNVHGTEYFDWDPTIHTVAEYDGGGLTPVNLIGLNIDDLTIDKNIRRFDLGLCWTAFNGTTCVSTPEFWHDVDRKEFTVRSCRNETQFSHTLRRHNRLKVKYDWPLVVPPEFEKFDTRLSFDDLGDLS
jgi:hypothetical protein